MRSTSTSGRVETLAASAVVLATGGAGKVYRYTSNPDTATGDGMAMAWRAGCRVANMEFIQFHPTCLYHPQERSFLITEALRGEGGHLKLPDGSASWPRTTRGELAPRDIVARAIDFEMKKHGLDHVWLDARHLGEDFLKGHFPTIHARCLALGIDIARQMIPVVPAAHYTCGGVVTDLDGRSDLPGLYAVGETTYTGCTAPTAWPATRCSSAWCWAAPARAHRRQRGAGAGRCCPTGTRARSRTPTSRSSSPTTGTNCGC
jgi:L-aspartate oxidase